jgi:hypothetical protein
MRETPFTISSRYRQPDLEDIESLLDTNLFRSARSPWQNLSWRWDITSQDITEEEYFNQSSRHILIGLRKAKSIRPRELDFLIVDALTLNQFGEINATVLNDFVVLYSQIRVITTFYIAALPALEHFTPPYLSIL